MSASHDPYAHADGSRECRPLDMPRSAEDERNDFIAALEKRRENCAMIEANDTASDDSRHRARIMGQQLDVLIDDLRAGLHEGCAAMRAGMA